MPMNSRHANQIPSIDTDTDSTYQFIDQASSIPRESNKYEDK